MKLPAWLVTFGVSAVPCLASDPEPPPMEGKPTAQELVRLRELYFGGSVYVRTPPPPLLSDDRLRAALCPQRAVAAWAAESLRRSMGTGTGPVVQGAGMKTGEQGSKAAPSRD